MDAYFTESQKLFTDELNWYTAKMTEAGETFVAEAEKAAKTAQSAWSEAIERQTAMASETAKRTSAIMNKQIELIRSAWQPAERA